MIYETVVGLEVHVELSTKTKIFCGCTTQFGGDPNTHVCPICCGMPGTLPLLNKEVVDYAIRTGLALNCDITRKTKFDRKNYFYPDLPKAYQISQLYLPICTNGSFEIEINGRKKQIGIHEIHMEEDAGKLIHDESANHTLIDYNRCGVPLLEIVTEPDLSSSEEAAVFLEKLRETLMYINVSDCRMQEGSMRADVNVSVRPAGSDTLGTRAELKNMSSFKAIRKAIEYESERQINILVGGGMILQETRRWDEAKEKSFTMRSKENAQDYRYFPEPNILPVEISEEKINKIKNSMPELPDKKRERYIKEYGLSEYDSSVITSERNLAFIFEKSVIICGKPKEVLNMITGEMMRLISETGQNADDVKISPEKIASLVNMISEGKINRTVGKEVFEEIFRNDTDPEKYVTEKGLMMIEDTDLIEKTIKYILEKNQRSVEDIRNGKTKAFGFLVGESMKALKGKADPKTVNELLKKLLIK